MRCTHCGHVPWEHEDIGDEDTDPVNFVYGGGKCGSVFSVGPPRVTCPCTGGYDFVPIRAVQPVTKAVN